MFPQALEDSYGWLTLKEALPARGARQRAWKWLAALRRSGCWVESADGTEIKDLLGLGVVLSTLSARLPQEALLALRQKSGKVWTDLAIQAQERMTQIALAELTDGSDEWKEGVSLYLSGDWQLIRHSASLRVQRTTS